MEFQPKDKCRKPGKKQETVTHKLKKSKAWRVFKKNPLIHLGSTLKTEPGRPGRCVRTSPTCVISKVNGGRLNSSKIASPRVGREHEHLFQF